MTYLLDNGIDLHFYQPTAHDMVNIMNSDLFIYVGDESDKWVERVLKQVNNKDIKVINLIEVLGKKVRVEEIKEGMHEENGNEDEKEIEFDEHVWLSLKNAKVICNEIEAKLEEIDLDNALDCFVAFVGCSAETEASFETIAFLANKVKEINCDTIYIFENCKKLIANTIISISGCDADIRKLNSAQLITKKDIENGISYISIMEDNYEVLSETLK